MIEKVVIYGGHWQFQQKTKKFIENGSDRYKVQITNREKKLENLPDHCWLIIYKDINLDLENLLVKIEDVENHNVILSGKVYDRDRRIGQNYGVDYILYIPECIGYKLDPYIREIEKHVKS